MDGAQRVQVDALGNFVGVLSQVPPSPGNNLKLSLDAKLEAVGQQALQESIDSNYPANGGAFVALNPDNGQVYAMGSLPTYNANLFTKPVTQSVYNAEFGPNSGDPQVNRAYQSAGPTGSTFKPITATAALESGVWSTSDIFDDTGQFCISGQCRHNAGNAVDGSLDLENAIKVSSDDFFYNLGALTNSPAPNGGPLQHWAHQYGIGRKTGIDLPDENAGTLPDAKWRARPQQDRSRVRQRDRAVRLHRRHQHELDRHPGWHRSPSGRRAAAGSPTAPTAHGRSATTRASRSARATCRSRRSSSPWPTRRSPTAARSSLRTWGSTCSRPTGSCCARSTRRPKRHLNINPFYLETIRAGLRAAASQPGGTSADVFQNFPEQVYGKTGTAQYTGQQDYAWYACFVPSSATTKPIVVVVTVEQGGFGAVGAAPVARQILSQWFFGNKGAYVAGSSKTL